ncbi:MAG: hypothetical protein ACLR8P_09495 [Clostridium fessum]
MRKQTIGLAGALMLCGISMLTGCGARGLEQAYSFQEREAQMTPAAVPGWRPFLRLLSAYRNLQTAILLQMMR